MNPSVSIVIPSFNCARFIGDALASIAGQQFTDHEVIVVDDGSDDDTETIVTSQYPRAIYIRHAANQGVSAARNRALAQCRGKYVAFLDADDAWLPWKLTAQVAALEANPGAALVGGQMSRFEDPLPRDECGNSAAIEEYSFREMLMRNRMATPTVVARRELLAKTGGFDCSLHIAEDYDLWLRLSRMGAAMKVGRVVARYRTRPDGLSAGNAERTFRLHCQYLRQLPERFPEEAGIARLARIHLAHLLLEKSIEEVDRFGDSWQGMASLAKSVWAWPWPLPTVTVPWIRGKRWAHTLAVWRRRTASKSNSLVVGRDGSRR